MYSALAGACTYSIGERGGDGKREQKQKEGGKRVKIISESEVFKTQRKIFYEGKDGGIGELTLEINASCAVMENMAIQLEYLATEAMKKVKEIVAAQEAPQQGFKKIEDIALDKWLNLQEVHMMPVGEGYKQQIMERFFKVE